MTTTRSFLTTLCASALFIVAGLSACKKDDTTDPDNNKGTDVEACISTAKDTFTLTETVQFTNCSKNADKFSWSFGDNPFLKDTTKNPSHKYAAVAAYQVSLVAKNTTAGTTSTTTKIIYIKDCPAGYEGANCNISSRTKFIGDYDVIELGVNTQEMDYVGHLTAHPTDPAKIVFTNLFGQYNVYGVISQSTKVTIPSQSPAAGVTISGSGSFLSNGTTISMAYSYKKNGSTDNVSGNWYKQ
jgi:PKD repeat protein